MRKLFAGVAAAALMTVGAAGMASAQDPSVGVGTEFPTGLAEIVAGNPFVINPPAAGGTAFLVSVEGLPSSFLIDSPDGLSVDFGVGGISGPAVITPGGDVLTPPQPGE